MKMRNYPFSAAGRCYDDNGFRPVAALIHSDRSGWQGVRASLRREWWSWVSSPVEKSMARLFEIKKVNGSVKLVAAAMVGAAGGLAATAAALGSVEFAIFGGVGGAVASMIGALSRTETDEA